MIDVSDIVNGIREEIRATPKYTDLHVEKRVREGAIWKLFIAENSQDRNQLDESLEGARVWWKGPPTGYAEVLSVVPDESQINLRFASGEPPNTGETIRVYLPQYRDALPDTVV